MPQRNTPVAIYELRDPLDGKTYYVGKSIHPQMRYQEHLADAKARPNSAKGRWIRGLVSEGQQPVLHIAQMVAVDAWMKAEADAIRAHYESRSPLTNVVMPTGINRPPAPPRPETYIHTQDYWDDLSPTVAGVQRRMFPFKCPEGYGLTVLFNMDARGWRYGYDLFAGGTTCSFDHIVSPYKNGYPPGFRTLTELVKSQNWFERAVLDDLFAVRGDGSVRTSYEEMSPIELFEPEQLGYWSSASGHGHVAR